MALRSRRRWSWAAVGFGLLITARGAVASTGVSVDVRGDLSPPVVHLAARPLEPDAGDRPPVELNLRAGKREAALDLSGASRWRLEAFAEGFWSAPAEVSPAGQPLVRLTLWPAAKVTAQVRPPPDTAPPRELRLRLSQPPPPPGSRAPAMPRVQPAEAEVLCPANETGEIDCLAPAGRWDLRAKAEGFAPHYFWDLALETSRTRSLGSLALRKGASLLGRVATETGPVDPAQAEVELRPMVFGGSDSQLGSQLRQLVLSARVNPLGYFHFDAVPSGSYTLEARQPGFEPVRVTPLAVREGDAVEIGDPLVLRPAPHFEVSVAPPRDPRRRSWRLLLLSSQEGAVVEAAQGESDRSGRWRSPPLPAGIYLVQVLDAEENLFAWREVTLSDAGQRVAIELALVEVVGTVRYGDEPLASRLVFGGRRGRSGVKVATESDDEGRFAVLLPRQGTWSVDVEADDPAVSALGLEVEVRRRRDRRPAQVDLEIPDTVIRGTVSDGAGEPVAGAWVHLARHEPHSSFGAITRTTARDGTFAIHGQLPGRCFVWARARTRAGETSDVSEVLLAAGTETPPLHLVVEEKRVLRGRVTSAAGAAVAGARVFAATFSADAPTLPGEDQTAADLDGAFELKLPRKTAEVQLVVMAPGYPLAAWRVRLREQTTALALQLGDSHGTLRLPRTPFGSVTYLFPLVLVDGQPLGGDLLRSWALAGNGGSPSGDLQTVSAMPPGSYRYCELEPHEALLVLWGAAVPAESACSEGYLTAGGELTLRSPAERTKPAR